MAHSVSVGLPAAAIHREWTAAQVSEIPWYEDFGVTVPDLLLKPFNSDKIPVLWGSHLFVTHWNMTLFPDGKDLILVQCG